MKIDGGKVLVTGAGGFVGSHLVERLAGAGCTVRCLVEYDSRGDIGWLDDLPADIRGGLEIIGADLFDADAVGRCVAGTDAVFHLGALIAIPYSYMNPRHVVETNVIGTLNVMLACRDHGVERVVHTSTSEVYGTAQYVPIDEKHPLQGQSPYAASKIGADKIAESFHLSYHVPVATLRPFNVYGPRQSARAVIPTIISQALWTGKVKLGALTPTRDFTYAADTAEAFIAIAECDEAVGMTINAGSGREISIGDLARKIAGLAGVEAETEHDAERLRPGASEVERLLADSSLARETFGWQPRVSLDDGLAQTIEWIRTHPERFDPGSYTI